jgi:hypothetical protein
MTDTSSIKNLIGTFSSEMTADNLAFFIVIEKPEGGYVVGGNMTTDNLRRVLKKIDKRNAVSLQHENEMQG